MPTYDYVCSACGKAFEQFQEMSAKKLRKCPRCGKSALERQVGAGAGLIFKGSGFYITDYRSSGYSDKKKKEGGDGASTTPASPPAAKPGAAPAAAEKPKKSPGKKGKD